ncbi:MAG: PEP-CTERM sorting domain-containing protein [Phormidesmis sp.]
MQKISALLMGATLAISSSAIALPAAAAQLEFSFTTESGGTGSFVLDTDTTAVPEADLPSFFTIREGNQAYLGAVSDFSFSSPDVSFEGLDADYGVFPAVEFGELLGVPEVSGAYTAVYAPAGCLFEPTSFCPTEFPIAYTGDLSALPDELSDDPEAYAQGFDLARVDEIGVITSDPLTSLSVKSVPEPGAMAGMLLLGAVGLGSSLKKRLAD